MCISIDLIDIKYIYIYILHTYPLNTRCTFHLLELGLLGPLGPLGPGDLPFSLGDDFTCLHPRISFAKFLQNTMVLSPGGDAGFECNERSYENARNLSAETRHRRTKH